MPPYNDNDIDGNPIEVGEEYIITRASTSAEDKSLRLWNNSWVIQMDAQIGKAYTVKSIRSNHTGIRFEELTGRFDYSFPPFVLKKVSQKQAETCPFEESILWD